MAIFAVIIQAGPGSGGLATAIHQHFPRVNYPFDGNRGWLVAAKATAKEVSDALGITDGASEAALVVEVASYFGRANPSIWTWIKDNWEAGQHG